eukprot:326387_1
MLIVLFICLCIMMSSSQSLYPSYAYLVWYIEMEANISTHDALDMIMSYQITEYLDVSALSNISYTMDFEWQYCNHLLIQVNVNLIVMRRNHSHFINFTALTNEINRDWNQFYNTNDICLSETYVCGVTYSHQNRSSKDCMALSPTTTDVMPSSTTADTNHDNDHIVVPATCSIVSLFILSCLIYLFKIRNTKRANSIHIHTGSSIEVIRTAAIYSHSQIDDETTVQMTAADQPLNEAISEHEEEEEMPHNTNPNLLQLKLTHDSYPYVYRAAPAPAEDTDSDDSEDLYVNRVEEEQLQGTPKGDGNENNDYNYTYTMQKLKVKVGEPSATATASSEVVECKSLEEHMDNLPALYEAPSSETTLEMTQSEDIKIK